MKHKAEIGVKNGGKNEIKLIVEPWAEEFPIAPGETITLIALSECETPWFNVIYHSHAIQVYVEDADSFEVR